MPNAGIFTSWVRQHFNAKNNRLGFSSVAYSHFSFSIFVSINSLLFGLKPPAIHLLNMDYFFSSSNHFKWCVQNIWISNFPNGKKAGRQSDNIHCYSSCIIYIYLAILSISFRWLQKRLFCLFHLWFQECAKGFDCYFSGVVVLQTERPTTHKSKLICRQSSWRYHSDSILINLVPMIFRYIFQFHQFAVRYSLHLSSHFTKRI